MPESMKQKLEPYCSARGEWFSQQGWGITEETPFWYQHKPELLGCALTKYMNYFRHINYTSRMAQWKRAGPITQRSVDRNYLLLVYFSTLVISIQIVFLNSLSRVPNIFNLIPDFFTYSIYKHRIKTVYWHSRTCTSELVCRRFWTFAHFSIKKWNKNQSKSKRPKSFVVSQDRMKKFSV